MYIYYFFYLNPQRTEKAVIGSANKKGSVKKVSMLSIAWFNGLNTHTLDVVCMKACPVRVS